MNNELIVANDAVISIRLDEMSTELSRLNVSSTLKVISAKFNVDNWLQVDWDALRRNIVDDSVSTDTKRKYFTQSKAMARVLVENGLLTEKVYAKIVRTYVIKGRNDAIVDTATHEQVARLISACDTTTCKGIRDYAIVQCFIRLGLRRNEIANLRWDNFNWSDNKVTIQGKGGVTAQLPIGAELKASLLEWRTASNHHEYVFTSFIRNADEQTNRKLTGQGIHHIIQALANKSGAGTVSPHSLRRYFACFVYERLQDVTMVSDWMRHAQVNTTQLYLRSLDRSARLEKSLDMLD